MFILPPHPTQPLSRRGAVLLVVITMLVLFAAVALAFVYYASSQATESRYGKDAQTSFRPDADPELLLSFFLGQLIYGHYDDATGVYSALRGHDLARGEYDYADFWDGQKFCTLVGYNSTPYDGIGRPHTGAGTYMNPYTQDDYNLVNYTYFSADGFLRDPGRAGSANTLPVTGQADPRGAYVGGFNAGYTYCDLNTMCLAAVDASGTVRQQSFFRSWTGIGSLDPTANTNWQNATQNPTLLTTNPALKYMTLRPLPAYHTVGTKSFPPPDDPGGDVKCLEGLPGVPVPGQPGMYYNNDSIWVDIGFPVLTDPTTGRKFKPLFAAAVVDLDGKINLNASGNVRGANNTHVSDQGWGIWEVSLARAMTQGKQWPNLFTGNGTITGRYGKDGQPNNSGTVATPGQGPSWYSIVDYDGADYNNPNYGSPLKVLLAGDPNNPYANQGLFLTAPYFPPSTYGNGNVPERTNHPLLFNPITPQGDDRIFAAREMEALLRYTGTGTPALNSDLFGLCPLDFGFSRTRLLLTTHSFDLNRPGAMPWLSQVDNGYVLNVTTNPPVPQGGNVGSSTPTFTGTPPYPAGEFQATRRAATALLGRFNVNLGSGPPATAPYLRPYPAPDPTTGQINTANAGIMTQYQNALQDRQNLASNLFGRLVWVTTGQQLPSDPTALKTYMANVKAGNLNQYNALRWLAQLAVNMVDYVDGDTSGLNNGQMTPQSSEDCITPFNWDPNDPTGGWVFGVERPRIELNEAYIEIDNTPADLTQILANLNNAAQLQVIGAAITNYQVNVWVELHNPSKADPNLPDPIDNTKLGAARLSLPGDAAPGVYRVVIAQATNGNVHTRLTDITNTLGDLRPMNGGPYMAEVMTIAENYTPDPNQNPQPGGIQDLVLAADGAFQGANGQNAGFYVLGPATAFPGNPKNANYPTATLWMKDQPGYTEPMTNQAKESSMTYALPVANLNQANQHTLLLQRLACPYLPPDPNPANPTYNPYVTIDYIENVPGNNGIQLNAGGNQVNTITWPTMSAYGRKQPYAAYSDINAANAVQTDSQLVAQTPDSASAPPAIVPYPDMPQHTLFRHNSVGNAAPANPSPYGAKETLTIPFDWFVHQDRQVVNPIELLSVSACRPSQLTQLFMSGGAAPNATTPFAHQAPWTNQATRLYRFLEFIETATRTPLVEAGGRLPGKVNINTLWDTEILDALLDPQPTADATHGSYFQSSVSSAALLQSLLKSRTPNGNPSQNDRPFLPLSAPYVNPVLNDVQYPAPNGVGIGDTVLRTDPSDPTKLLFGVSPTTQRNPYLQAELLQKIFNNITTRSNVFAVWLTVGFFEVTDENARPVKLGPEIGKDQGRNVRHRMFAIIDRSNLAVPQITMPDGVTPVTLTAPVTAAPTAQPVVITAASGTNTAPAPVGVTMNWTIQPGSTLTVGTGATQETVTVQAVNGTTITAVFTQNHNTGDPVSIPGTPGPVAGTVLGNPGPQQRYNPRSNGAVVLHFNIIE
jgi:hypothetical protein